ncbi:MAG: ATP-binding cassette domain-containing protein, partial [Candidatus Levyibacteriota bacterium]
MYAMLYEVPDKKKRITKLTKEFEIDHLRKKQFYMLSAGEKTRLLLTKAFLNYPKLILLDEPTASLDVDVAVKIRDFLKKEQSEYNVSVLLTSHNMAEVEEMCNRVIIINNGKIVAHDTPENLAKKMKHSTLHLLIQEQKEKMEKLLEMKNMKHQHRNNQFSITIEEKEIADFLMLLAKEKIGYAEVTIDKPDLEDFFLEVVNS